MKNIFFIAAALSLASCASVKYSSKIESRGVSQQCRFVPAANYQDDGFTNAVAVPGGTVEVCDSVYTLSPTWGQAFEQMRKHGQLGGFIAGGAVVAGTLSPYVVLTSGGLDAYPLLALPATAILVGGPMLGGPAEWYKWNSDREIKKADYVRYSQQSGGFRSFWSTPVKAY